jgi:hypothetical protein
MEKDMIELIWDAILGWIEPPILDDKMGTTPTP